MKRKIIIITLFIASYLIIFAFSRFVFNSFYTPEWTSRNVLLFAAIITIVPLFFNKYKFAITTLIGYILGVFIGEILGKATVDIFHPNYPSPGSLHEGWILWGFVFLLSIIIGIAVEIIKSRQKKN
ncbi:MAG: hypothetical protein FWC41_13565 [Firmicutes bacterium]|nr:hypothetical protein [Bacillota bacterium]